MSVCDHLQVEPVDECESAAEWCRVCGALRYGGSMPWMLPTTQQAFAVVLAPGDECGGTGRVNGAGVPCPGCRACS